MLSIDAAALVGLDCGASTDCLCSMIAVGRWWCDDSDMLHLCIDFLRNVCTAVLYVVCEEFSCRESTWRGSFAAAR